jgi:DNA-binding XRE family transcriptional regulator
MKNNNQQQADSLDRETARKFQAKLKQLRDDLASSNTEMARGLRVARATFISFINNEDVDKMLPITAANILTLWQTLSESQNIKKNKSNLEHQKAKERRQKLLEHGPAELLAAAGFTPIDGDWIKVDSYQYPQMLRIALLLCNDWVDVKSYMEITQQFLDILMLKVQDSVALQQCEQEKNNLVNTVEETLIKHPILDPTSQDKLLTQYNKAYRSFSKTLTLSTSEQIGLASTIILNEVTKEKQLPWSLRILGYEFIQLTIFIKKDKRWENIYQSFMEGSKIERDCLSITKPKIEANSKDYKDGFPTVTPVIKSKIICRSENESNNQVIPFYFISSWTPLSAAFNSISLHFGLVYSSSVFKVENKSLETDVNSLVKSTVILKLSKQNGSPCYFQGDWVGQDLIKTAIQALIIGTKKLVGFGLNQKRKKYQVYKKIVSDISSLREKIYDYYQAAQTYNFNEQIVTAESFAHLSQESYAHFNEIEQLNSIAPFEFSFAIESFRIYLLSQTHRIRLNHILGELDTTQKCINDTKTVINDCFPDLLDPESDKIEIQALKLAKILFEAEEKLLDLTLGKWNYKQNDLEKIEELENWKESKKDEIKKHLNLDQNSGSDQDNKPREKISYAPGWTTFQSLAEIHFLVGQYLFYTGNTRDAISKAYKNFSESAYFYSRIGLGHRTAQVLALAGRCQVRLKDSQRVEESKALVEQLMTTNFTANQSLYYQEGLKSDLYLLNAEYYTVIKENYEQGIMEALKGLKGSLWIGFTRRVTENLYTIYRCAKCLPNRDVEQHFNKLETFSILWEISGDDNKLYEKLLSENCRKNIILRKVIKLLSNTKELVETEEMITWDHDQIAKDFKDTLSQIWHDWYKYAHPEEESPKHPIGEQIASKTFLSPIESD